jgi:GDP-L-fucose synthase
MLNMSRNLDDAIFVAGHRGMVGSAIVRRLRALGYRNILTATRAELDLLDQRAVHAYLAQARPDYIFIAAAKVGGIAANNEYRADFLYDNLVIEANRDPRRAPGRRAAADVPWLELHLPARLPAAD